MKNSLNFPFQNLYLLINRRTQLLCMKYLHCLTRLSFLSKNIKLGDVYKPSFIFPNMKNIFQLKNVNLLNFCFVRYNFQINVFMFNLIFYTKCISEKSAILNSKYNL